MESDFSKRLKISIGVNVSWGMSKMAIIRGLNIIITLKSRLTAISLIWPPHYYGHFFWLPGKNRHTSSCKKTVINILYGHLVDTAKFFWPIGDPINRVPLYLFAGEANKFYKSNSFPSKTDT